ncbi:MAG TPA: ArsR family transcriptional regulator [Ktedonobacteraceae bacterium]|nr:ArsR family transcriptional regulator [Ktedonobacteraceae bacterium]
MAIPQQNQRFFSSTRGQIVLLLRRKARTVDELAQMLHLTDNAIRAHLATLERDGIVRQQGMRRIGSKPSVVYELAAGAEQLFPKAYGAILHQLLDVLAECMTAEELEVALREVGRRIAAHWNISEEDLRTHLEAAVEVLNELGGMAELEVCDAAYCIRGYSCPLAAAVPGHPEVCRLAETLLSTLIGVPVQERCERGEALHCRFIVSEARYP